MKNAIPKMQVYGGGGSSYVFAIKSKIVGCCEVNGLILGTRVIEWNGKIVAVFLV